MMITGMPESVTAAIGSPSASKMVGEITIADGLEPAALSRTEICPAASSLGVPSLSIFTPSCLPAASAPLNTHCQYSDVVALTITATVSSALAASIPIADSDRAASEAGYQEFAYLHCHI